LLNSLLKRICLMAMALALGAPAVLADTLTLTGVNPAGTNLGGVYTGPYVATINGVSDIMVICDDFQTHTSLNQLLTVTETKVSDLTGPDPNQVVKFDRDSASDQQADYMTAAYLATQMIAVDQSTMAGRLQASLLNYAIWFLFYDQALNGLTGSQQTTAMGFLTDAQTVTSSYTVDMYSNVSIWTPTPNSAAQEFISVRLPNNVVRVPEPSMSELLAFNAIVLGALGWFLRRRGVQLAS
jgi:hypothetical protein